MKEKMNTKENNKRFICENPLCKKKHRGLYGSGRFCSSKCARSFSGLNRSKESRLKTSKAMSRFYDHVCPICGKNFLHKGTNPNTWCDECRDEHIEKCKWCNKEFKVKSYSKRECCCNSHSQKYHSALKYKQLISLANSDIKKIQLQLKLYRMQCSFRFSLDQYPDEFDFDLIRKYGWYSAKNHGNNLNGISRDHMFSVKEGFINHIDPKIISHPANCKLVRHSENAKKKDKSSISLSELLRRIEYWNKKYNQ